MIRKLSIKILFSLLISQCYKIDGKGHIVEIAIAYPESPQIGIFPRQICDLKYLEFLYLCNGNIKEIPKSIKKLKNLRVLDLSYNSIQEIPNSIRSFLDSLEMFAL